MNCPFSRAIEFPDRCPLRECWYNYSKARHSCAALDTGSTHMVVDDVARVSGTTVTATEEMVERGRRKAEDWRRMLTEIADVDSDSTCSRCGADSCSGVDCARDARDVARLKDLLPLDSVERMTPARWRRVLELVRAGSTVAQLRI